jgi:hypothetical protein
MRNRKIDELLRVYHDVERTLKQLKKNAERNLAFDSSPHHINVRKLIAQLSRTKRRIERKIGNTLLLEKQHLKRRLKELTAGLSVPRRTET